MIQCLHCGRDSIPSPSVYSAAIPLGIETDIKLSLPYGTANIAMLFYQISNQSAEKILQILIHMCIKSVYEICHKIKLNFGICEVNLEAYHSFLA